MSSISESEFRSARDRVLSYCTEGNTEKKGIFVRGEFDQLQRNIPYRAWIQCLKEFVDSLLVERNAGHSEPEKRNNHIWASLVTYLKRKVHLRKM